MRTKLNTLAIPILFEVGLILRLWNIGVPMWWYDEAFTALLSRLPLDAMIAATAGDTHPPLYYLITWTLAHLGANNELALRLPSVLFSMLALYLTWRLAVQLKFSRRATIAALALMTFSPVEVTYAQETRMYAMLQALVLLAVLAALQRRRVLLAIAGVALFYTHNYALFYWPVIGLLALFIEIQLPVHVGADHSYRRPGTEHHTSADEARVPQLIIAIAVPVIAFLPWLIVLFGQMAIVESGYWIQAVTPGAVLWALFNLFWAFSMPELWQGLAVLLPVGAIVFCTIRSLQRREGRVLVWLGLAPLSLAIIASLVWKPLLLFRGLLGTLPFLYMLIALILFSGQNKLNRVYAVALLAPIVLVGLVNYYLYTPITKGTGREQVRYLLEPEWQPGDAIATINDGGAVILSTYAPDLPLYEIDGGCPPALGSLSPQTRQALGFQSASWDQITKEHPRIWLVGSVGPTASECEENLHEHLTGIAQAILVTTDTDIAQDGVWLYEATFRSQSR